MPTNFKEFEIDLTKTAEKLEGPELVKLHKAIVSEVFARIIERTPVDEGILKGNWHLTIGVISSAFIPEKSDKTGAMVLSENISKLVGLKPYQVVWIVNNTDYSVVWEEGSFIPPNPGPSKDPRPDRKGKILVSGGFSTQSPQGMVSITVAEIQAALS